MTIHEAVEDNEFNKLKSDSYNIISFQHWHADT